MIFCSPIRVQQRGFEFDPADLARIGVFDRSVCWGVWVPDPRGQQHQRKHLLISPVHPTVWPFLLRMEIKLREKTGAMAAATRVLVDSHLNIQFAESATSGHHHATWNVVAEANDVRGALHDDFIAITRLPDEARLYENAELQEFSNRLAKLMLAKAVRMPKEMEAAHRRDESYRKGDLDCGFLHNRIVDRDVIKFFYEPAKMPPKLREVAKKGLPQAVTCRWMQNTAFFAVYGEMRHPLRLQYDAAARLLRLPDQNHGDLRRTLEATTLPSRAVASFDTAGLYLRVDIIEPADVRTRFVESSIDYDINFTSTKSPGKDDTACGLWLSVCERVAERGIDLVKIANRTTHRDDRSEAGSITLIGKAAGVMDDRGVAELDHALRQCRPQAKVRDCDPRPTTKRMRSDYRVFVSRRLDMAMFREIEDILQELGDAWGFRLDFVNNPLGKSIDGEVENQLMAADGLLQIMSYSNDELKRARADSSVRPNLQWLFHEYGIAIGAGKPHVRLFDVTNRELRDWTALVGPRGSEAAGSYDRDKGLSSIRDDFERAFAALVLQIDERRHGADALP